MITLYRLRKTVELLSLDRRRGIDEDIAEKEIEKKDLMKFALRIIIENPFNKYKPINKFFYHFN
jgi:hypothetical protein